MKTHALFTVVLLASSVLVAQAQLHVQTEPPKVVGQKVITKLTMKNTFAEKVESARATMFLLDEQGKMVGQGTRWVIGGTPGQPGLAPGATNVFNFVVERMKPTTSTNAPQTKLLFNRVVLEGGRTVNPLKDVEISSSPADR